MKESLFGLLVSVCAGVAIGGLANAADDPITLKLESLENVRGNGALEACGTATHKDGTKPLLITVKHDESLYSVPTAPNGKWCVVFKRWTFDGKIDVAATTLVNPGNLEFKTFDISAVSK